MAENNLSLKIFLRDENIHEARRIAVDASVATSYLFMKEKLETVFPNLRNAQFKITWKDIDDDEITITSDEDFITAFTEMPGNVKVLTIRVMQRCPEPPAFTCTMNEEPSRPLIICDACDRTVLGFRYKCLQCPDFDLCGDCEFQGCHSNHVMVRLPNNETYSPKCARKFMHHIARNLKKTAYNASKEAYRATKYASKYNEKCKQSEHNSTSGTEHENEPHQPSQNCPFNLKDVHALGTLARENLTQLLESIPSTSQTQTSSEKNDQGAMLFDVLRNAVDTFFGRCPQNPTSAAKTEENKTSENTHSPMETEVIPSAPASTDTQNAEAVPIYPNLKTSASQNETVEESPSQPQWTFVASNPKQSQNSTEEPAKENQPKVAFIYHENPAIAEGLVKLHEMGFSNETGVLSSLLEHFNGNVSDVVKAIFDKKI